MLNRLFDELIETLGFIEQPCSTSLGTTLSSDSVKGRFRHGQLTVARGHDLVAIESERTLDVGMDDALTGRSIKERDGASVVSASQIGDRAENATLRVTELPVMEVELLRVGRAALNVAQALTEAQLEPRLTRVVEAIAL